MFRDVRVQWFLRGLAKVHYSDLRQIVFIAVAMFLFGAYDAYECLKASRSEPT